MKRLLMAQLLAWKNNRQRKPLILKGVRQVGKTYVLQEFGKENFSNTHYFNFEKERRLHTAFDKDLNPKQIIQELSLIRGVPIYPEKELIIFDEIQECPLALTSLKYFCEDLPESFICSAGSLLGVHLGQVSFPVGKVNKLIMQPMAFVEFLQAIGETLLAEHLLNLKEQDPISDIVHEKLWHLLKHYFITGGLPEVITIYNKHKEQLVMAFEAVRKKQLDLIDDYFSDIAKHSGKVNAMHINRIWHSVPEQLARNQNSGSKKFKFKNVIPGIDRFAKMADAIDWLESAGLVLKTHIVNTARLPCSAYTSDNKFKLYLFDVGILGAMANLSPKSILEYAYGSYKGFFAENYVAQAFKFSNPQQALYSWEEGTSEIEFLQQLENNLIPVEVKAGYVTQAKSLQVFLKKYQPSYSVITSAKPLAVKKESVIKYYPLYLAELFPL